MQKVEYKIVVLYQDTITEPIEKMQLHRMVKTLSSSMFKRQPRARLLVDECSSKELQPREDIQRKFLVETETGEEKTVTPLPGDIMIVHFSDGFFNNLEKPIYISNLENYEVPIKLLMKNNEGSFIEYKVIEEVIEKVLCND